MCVTPVHMSAEIECLANRSAAISCIVDVWLYLQENNQQPQAIQLLNQALQIDPAFCSAAVHKGLALASLGDREAALQTFLAVSSPSDKST